MEVRLKWGRCYLCGIDIYKTFVEGKNDGIYRPRAKYDDCYTRDHVVPKSQGGTKTKPCCRGCNRKKGDLSELDYRNQIGERT